jgi:hypothetical protein
MGKNRDPYGTLPSELKVLREAARLRRDEELSWRRIEARLKKKHGDATPSRFSLARNVPRFIGGTYVRCRPAWPGTSEIGTGRKPGPRRKDALDPEDLGL